MAAFATLDRDLTDATEDLHDYLWTGAKHDEKALLARLEAGAGGLDRYLGTDGLLADAVRPLAVAFEPRGIGPDLFTFLHVVGNLAGAVEGRAHDAKEAARRASEVVVSNSIHLAAAAGRFEIVEAFESGKTDFQSFQENLRDVLTDRGVLPARDLPRAANLAYDLHATWDDERPEDARLVAATGAIVNAGLHAHMMVDALRDLGRYRDPPFAALAPAIRKMFDRLGAHA
ncbi:MAG: hypothetical protein ACT4OI_09300 [Methanobacteriota archaeon]